MEKKLLENLGKEYTKEDLKVLEDIESYFHVSSFDDFDLVNFGNLMVSTLFEWNEQASITVIREKDGLPVYQFISAQKAQRNVDFAMKKRNAVLKTQHSSFWGLVKQVVDQNEMFLDENVLCVAGAFPIFVKDEHQYTICVSGMHEGKDFYLVTKAWSEYYDQDLPKFEKVIF